MEYMITTETRTKHTAPQQMTLLSEAGSTKDLTDSTAHARFRLSKTTRQRGLEHVAEIRRQLAETQARNNTNQLHPLPARRNRAA
jgi:hypothetical protein